MSKTRSNLTAAIVVVLVAMLLVVAVGSPASAGQTAPTDDDATVPIVGGTEVNPPGKYPFVVELVRPGNAAHCAGSLIDARWVLTAAHCLTDDNGVQNLFPGTFTIAVGRHDRTTANGEQIAASQIVLHPNWTQPGNAANFRDDIALIELATPATLGTPVRLASPSDAALWAEGQVGTVIGWGFTLPASMLSDTLMEVVVPFWSDTACAVPWSLIVPADDVCAGGEVGKDSCSGDSGGPLIAQSGTDPVTLVGIVSFGTFPCATPAVPAVHSEVASYLEWIQTTTNLVPSSTLTITKDTAGSTAPSEFSYTVTPDVVGCSAEQTATIPSTGGSTTVTVRDQADGTNIVCTYTVTEAAIDDYSSAPTTIASVAAAGTAAFGNTQDARDTMLTVTKTVVGEPAPVDFSFTVTPEVAGCTPAQSVTIGAAGGTATVVVTDLAATTGIPCTYTVTESPVAGYTAAATQIAGVIADGTAAFTNTQDQQQGVLTIQSSSPARAAGAVFTIAAPPGCTATPATVTITGVGSTTVAVTDIAEVTAVACVYTVTRTAGDPDLGPVGPQIAAAGDTVSYEPQSQLSYEGPFEVVPRDEPALYGFGAAPSPVAAGPLGAAPAEEIPVGSEARAAVASEVVSSPVAAAPAVAGIAQTGITTSFGGILGSTLLGAGTLLMAGRRRRFGRSHT